jgi:hypothetical protein
MSHKYNSNYIEYIFIFILYCIAIVFMFTRSFTKFHLVSKLIFKTYQNIFKIGLVSKSLSFGTQICN